MVNIDSDNLQELIKKGIVICREKRRNHPFGIFYGENPLEYSFTLLLLEFSFYIAVSRVIRFMLKPLKQPKLISNILGGIVLGPSVLGRSKKFGTYMFPDYADFVLENMAMIGLMYFLFISGVKMDLMLAKRVGKKHWSIAFFGVFVPLCCTVSYGILERKSLDKPIAKPSSIWGISSSLSITAFPVLYHMVKEFNLLSSEIGRMALSTSIVSDIIGINGVIIFEATVQGENRPMAALWYTISLIIVLAAIFGGVRQAMLWIIRTTPEGKPVDQVYVIAILLFVMVIAFFCDMLGLALLNGPIWLGLAIPDGPPLGTILVEKSETILNNLFMPFTFMYIGLITDVSSISGEWSSLRPLFFMVLTGYATKMVSTLVTSRFFNMTFRDSLTLSLIMSLRGEVELLLFLHWMNFKIIGRPQFTILVLLTIAVTSISSPLISILYDPTKPYMLNKRRNIQHTPPDTEIHIVACIHGEESLPGIMKLLEVSNPTTTSPFSVYALCLVELVGRANPVFIDHDNEDGGSTRPDQVTFNSSILNALAIFQEARVEYMKIRAYTAITPKRSMYQEICELALAKKVSLIILTLDKNYYLHGYHDGLTRTVNTNVMAHAPCSVGILVDKFPYQNLVNGCLRISVHRLIVLFLGGSDAREALAYADRMASNRDVSLTVIRFLVQESEGEDEMEKKLDDGLVTWFWVKNEANGRIVYREVVVKNGEETIAAIQALDKDFYDLWIVGRKHGINPLLLRGLANWGENNELGVIGDYVASGDFGASGSVLVVQQQVLREQEKDTSSSLTRISFCK